MGKADTPEIKTPAPPVESSDAEVGADMEANLLRRRKGASDAYLTKGQKKPTLLQLGNKSEL